MRRTLTEKNYQRISNFHTLLFYVIGFFIVQYYWSTCWNAHLGANSLLICVKFPLFSFISDEFIFNFCLIFRNYESDFDRFKWKSKKLIELKISWEKNRKLENRFLISALFNYFSRDFVQYSIFFSTKFTWNSLIQMHTRILRKYYITCTFDFSIFEWSIIDIKFYRSLCGGVTCCIPHWSNQNPENRSKN